MNQKEKAFKIIETLENNGYEAFIIGGAIRDELLGLIPKDYDITTNAKPDEVKQVFSDFRIIDTGLKHGTVSIIFDDDFFEITTYRKDGIYEDCRRPKEIFYTESIIEDLSRRDFTCNAIAWNGREFIDPYGGIEDLKLGILQTVGDPNDRFREDALRMLRAVRIALEKNMFLHHNTRNSIIRNKNLLHQISRERIREEFNKIIFSNYGIKNLISLSLIDVIFPEIKEMFNVDQNNPYHIYDVGNHTIRSMNFYEGDDLSIKLALLFHDIGKIDTRTTDEDGIDHFYKHSLYSEIYAEKFLKKYKYDNQTIENVLILIRCHDIELFDVPSKKQIKKMLNLIGFENFEKLLIVKECDIKAQYSKYLNRLDNIKIIRNMMEEIKNENEAFSIKDLAINGDDLISFGLKEGKQIGMILNNVLELVIEDKLKNSKIDIMNYIHNLLDNA